MSPTNPKPAITEVTLERAYEIAAELDPSTKSEVEFPQSKTVSGRHPTLGDVHVVITPIGNPLLLPFVIQNFSV